MTKPRETAFRIAASHALRQVFDEARPALLEPIARITVSCPDAAVGDMLALTDKPYAPWHLVPANNKRFARLTVLKTACKQIETNLGGAQ